MAESATRETSETRETATIVPVTGAIYSNGQEKPSSRWSFEIGLNLTEDKFLSTVLKRLEKGYGIKDKCAALNITKFKLQASAKDFTPILPEWPKGRIFSVCDKRRLQTCRPADLQTCRLEDLQTHIFCDGALLCLLLANRKVCLRRHTER